MYNKSLIEQALVHRFSKVKKALFSVCLTENKVDDLPQFELGDSLVRQLYK